MSTRTSTRPKSTAAAPAASKPAPSTKAPKSTKVPKTPKVKKSAGAPAEHPPYSDMIKSAVVTLKDRNGSSRQAIKKYILASYKVGENAPTLINSAIKRGAEAGIFLQPKGASGPVKLAKKEPVSSSPKKSKKAMSPTAVSEKPKPSVVKKPRASSAAKPKKSASASSPAKKTKTAAAKKKAVKKPAADAAKKKKKVAAKKKAATKAK